MHVNAGGWGRKGLKIPVPYRKHNGVHLNAGEWNKKDSIMLNNFPQNASIKPLFITVKGLNPDESMLWFE